MRKTPDWLLVSNSMLYGTTVYAVKNIPKYHVICKTSIDNLNRGEGFIETPAGNLFHHTPHIKEVNCVIEIVDNEFIEVIAKHDIREGDELLINYDINPHRRYFSQYSIH